MTMPDSQPAAHADGCLRFVGCAAGTCTASSEPANQIPSSSSIAKQKGAHCRTAFAFCQHNIHCMTSLICTSQRSNSLAGFLQTVHTHLRYIVLALQRSAFTPRGRHYLGAHVVWTCNEAGLHDPAYVMPHCLSCILTSACPS